MRLFDPQYLDSVEGLGTGKLVHITRQLLLRAVGFFSGMSSKARGYDEALIEGKQTEYAMPKFWSSS